LSILQYYYNNKEKCAERRKEWYERTRDVRNNKQRVKNNERKQQAVEYKGGVCFKCGLSYPPAVFEFHHTDPSNKDKDLTRYKQLKWDRMQIELDKCILLCANCHRLTHHGGEDW